MTRQRARTGSRRPGASPCGHRTSFLFAGCLLMLLSLGCQVSPAASPASVSAADRNSPAPPKAVDPVPAEAAGPEEPVGPLRKEPLKPAEYVSERLAPDAAVTLRYRLGATRRIVYAGISVEETLAGVGDNSVEPVARLTWKVVRRHLILGAADGAPGELVSNSLEELAGAAQAGRDALAAMRERPSGGRRLGAGLRRISDRGVEPLASDSAAEQLLEPLSEFPRLPRGRLTAAAPLVEMADPYVVEWRLVGAGSLGARQCWQVTRNVAAKAGMRPAPGEVLGFQDEYLFDAADSTVLRAKRVSKRPAGFLGQARELTLSLVEDQPETAAAFAREAEETKAISRLRGLIVERRADEAAELAEETAQAGRGGAVVTLARRFAAGEKALAEPRGGARRVDLVPEDTYVLLRAPEKMEKGVKLVPVVFFHGAGANPLSYFRDWEEKAGDRPLLLVFPRSRYWTWQIEPDAAVVGSLLERLARTYELDRDRLVLAGHGIGAELTYALGYGVEFPGFRVRGIVAAGGTMSQKDPNMKRLRTLASDGKHEELASRVRAADVLALAGEEDKLYPLKDYQNVDRWLRSFNPKGVELLSSPGVGQQYSPAWTAAALNWIAKLKPLPAPATEERK